MISSTARIGDGAMISAGALVLPFAVIGRGLLLNTRSSIDHDSVIGDLAHFSCCDSSHSLHDWRNSPQFA